MSSTCGCSGSASSAIDSVLAAKSAKLDMQIGIAVLATANKSAQLEGAAAVQLLQETARLSEAFGKGENFSAIA
jgi:hypothetical protein